MATFVRCKQEYFLEQREKKVQVDTKVGRFLLLFKYDIPVYENVLGQPNRIFNNPVNIDLVMILKKQMCFSDKFAIKFGGSKYYEIWVYDTEKARDEQFEELANNLHLYKSKVEL